VVAAFGAACAERVWTILPSDLFFGEPTPNLIASLTKALSDRRDGLAGLMSFNCQVLEDAERK
jgi:hypothetical protein